MEDVQKILFILICQCSAGTIDRLVVEICEVINENEIKTIFTGAGFIKIIEAAIHDYLIHEIGGEKDEKVSITVQVYDNHVCIIVHGLSWIDVEKRLLVFNHNKYSQSIMSVDNLRSEGGLEIRVECDANYHLDRL